MQRNDRPYDWAYRRAATRTTTPDRRLATMLHVRAPWNDWAWFRERRQLAMMRSSDAEQRPRLLPPPDEHVQVRLVLVCQLYGPDRAHAFRDAAVRLGLRARFGDQDIDELLLSLRQGRGSAGPSPLGRVVGPNRQAVAFFGETAARELPDGVLDVHPSVAVFGGSVSVLICSFRLDENAGAAVQREIEAEHRTERRPDGVGYHEPIMTQRLAVDAARASLREQLAGWVARQAPGEFTAFDAPPPALVLQTHRTAEAEQPIGMLDWTASVRAAEARWRSTRWPALRMRTGGQDRRDRNALLVVGREQAVLQRLREGGVRMDVDEAWRHTTGRLTRSLETTLMLWAAIRFLAEQRASLAVLRDTLTGWDVAPRSAARRLALLGTHGRSLVASRAMAEGIAASAHPDVFAGYDANDWVPRNRGGAPSWFEGHLDAVRASAADLIEEERGLRERVALEIDLLAGGAGVRVARTALAVAVLATVLAGAAAGVSVVSYSRIVTTQHRRER